MKKTEMETHILFVSTGLANSQAREEFEVEKGSTAEEIHDIAEELMYQHLTWFTIPLSEEDTE